MNNSGISGLKIAVIFILFMGFMFVLMEQRIESREYDIRIRNIQKSIEELNSQKMDLELKIDSQLQRLSSYDYSSIGKPITMKDVVAVPVREAGCVPEAPEANPAANIFDRLIESLLSLF
jgi:hypothetical protein